MKKRGVILFLLFLMMSPVIAQSQQTLGGDDGFAPGVEIDLIQICSNCTFVNVTYIILGNGTVESINQSMIKDGSFFNFSLSDKFTQSLGEYVVNWDADPNGLAQSGNYNFFVRKNATRLSTAESILYVILIILTFSAFIFFLFLSISFPFNDTRDQKGAITRLIPSKYLKLFSILFCFGSLLWFMNIFSGIINNFVSLSLASTLTNNLTLLVYWFSYFATIIIFGIIFIMIYIDLLVPLIKIALLKNARRKK